MVGHVLHTGPAFSQQLGDSPHVLLGYVDREAFGGLMQGVVDLAQQHGGLSHGEFEALAAHCFDEDRQLQLASTLDFPGVGPLGGHDPE